MKTSRHLSEPIAARRFMRRVGAFGAPRALRR
jgi:hypothetical protein